MAIEKQATMTADSVHISVGDAKDPALIEADITDSSRENPKEKEHQRHLALLEENRALENRLQDLQDVFQQAYQETSLMKMKSIMAIGSIKLEIDSLQEDRQFLVQKYHSLKHKLEDYHNDMKDKNELLDALKAERRERRRSI